MPDSGTAIFSLCDLESSGSSPEDVVLFLFLEHDFFMILELEKLSFIHLREICWSMLKSSTAKPIVQSYITYIKIVANIFSAVI